MKNEIDFVSENKLFKIEDSQKFQCQDIYSIQLKEKFCYIF